MDTEFSEDGKEAIRRIVREEIDGYKEKDVLIKLITQRRRYTKLTGHLKMCGEKKCSCGQTLITSNKKSGGWLCPKEEQEWDYILFKISGEN